MIKTEGKDEANTSDMESEPSERNDIPMKPESVEDKNDESSSSSLSEAKEHSGQENEVSPHSNPSPNDGDMNKEVTSGSEETWVASSHLSGVEENESSLRKVNEINEEDIIIQVGFSGVDQDSEDSIPLAVHPGQVVKLESIHKSSFHLPTLLVPQIVGLTVAPLVSLNREHLVLPRSLPGRQAAFTM